MFKDVDATIPFSKREDEGTFSEGVKAELEKLGLTREIENQAEAESRAKEIKILR